jgi:hypothetical protein
MPATVNADALALVLASDADARLAIVARYVAAGADGLSPLWDALAALVNAALGERGELASAFVERWPLSREAFDTYDALAFLDAAAAGDAARLARLRVRALDDPARTAALTARLAAVARALTV